MSHNSLVNEFLQNALQKREQAGLLRHLSSDNGMIDFCSNDYLGLAQEHLMIPDASGQDDKRTSGSTGSRLVSGNSALAEETESFIAAYHQAETALLFNTGYMANLGLCSCIGDKETVFVYDEHIHASIIDGMRLSLAKRYKFKHNDINDLERKLEMASGKIFVIVESLYSMDGDLAPLQEIVGVCKAHQAALIVDEAHAVGIYGEQGRGLVCQSGLGADVWARIITFGKSLGCHGAAVVGSSLLRNFLINHARSFIYTTAMPPHAYITIQHAYHRLAGAGREKLFGLIHHFQKTAKTITLNDESYFLSNYTPIQAIVLPNDKQVKQLADYLRQGGFFVKAILSPTVPAGTERIRICLHAFNTAEEVDNLLIAIKSFFA